MVTELTFVNDTSLATPKTPSHTTTIQIQLTKLTKAHIAKRPIDEKSAAFSLHFFAFQNKSRAIAGTTARCAQYMSAQIIM